MKCNPMVVFFGIMGMVASCDTVTKESATDATAVVDSVALIKKGGYLVAIGGCGDCHSPKMMTAQGPVPDTSRLLSGYDPSRPFEGFAKEVALSGRMVVFNIESTAFAGPWGVSYAANLTPDASGIGTWTYGQFSKAMKEGKWKGQDNTRPLLPPMPWQNYKDIAEEDLQAIFAYLKSIKPVNNPIPAPVSPAAL